MSRSRKFSYNPDDAPADVAQAFGVPDDVCRLIAADHRKAVLPVVMMVAGALSHAGTWRVPKCCGMPMAYSGQTGFYCLKCGARG